MVLIWAFHRLSNTKHNYSERIYCFQLLGSQTSTKARFVFTIHFWNCWLQRNFIAEPILCSQGSVIQRNTKQISSAVCSRENSKMQVRTSQEIGGKFFLENFAMLLVAKWHNMACTLARCEHLADQIYAQKCLKLRPWRPWSSDFSKLLWRSYSAVSCSKTSGQSDAWS